LEAARISIIDNAFIMMHEYIASDGLNLILVFHIPSLQLLPPL
jgi:hypothetical protein